MGMRIYRPSSYVHRDKRWPALRQMAKRRDKFQCQKCGARHRLEVDHIKPVRSHPELAFDLGNLMTLCGRCHGSKTRSELGFPELSEDRRAWRDHVQAFARNHRVGKNPNA